MSYLRIVPIATRLLRKQYALVRSFIIPSAFSHTDVQLVNHLINTGKIFYWGTSEWTASEIADAWRVADKLGLIGPVAEQPQYNLLVRDKVEGDFRWLYEKYGTGLTIFSPLKQGILTGKYNGVEKPPSDSRLANAKDAYSVGFSKTFGNETWQKELEAVEKLKPVAEELGVSLAELAIAWTIKNQNVSSVIIGASRKQQVIDNIKALEVVDKLTRKTSDRIEEILANKPEDQPRRL